MKVSAAEVGVRICDVEDGAISPAEVYGIWVLCVTVSGKRGVVCMIEGRVCTVGVVEADEAKLKAQTRIMKIVTIEWAVKRGPTFSTVAIPWGSHHKKTDPELVGAPSSLTVENAVGPWFVFTPSWV